jgi:ribonuclease J
MTSNGGSLRLWALGGLGEVGMNCLVMEAEQRLIVIDCGLTFPDREPGVELIHPDFETLLARQDDLLAIVLTHGHEDHVGAIPYLLRDIDREIPVYGPPYALQVLRERLAEIEVKHPPPLYETKPREVLNLGPFEITPFRVTHSIPDSTGLVLKTPAGTVVHTGDFKLERDPLDGQSSDEELLRSTGDAGVRLLLSDSTNSEVAGCAGREQDVEAALRSRIEQAPARVIVCMFGSNIHRVGAVLRTAALTKRRVLLMGRSLRTHARIARELGLLPDHPLALVQEDEAQKIPRSELLVLATGSQGEPAAALRRMANGSHHKLKLEPGDEVILSSRIIPGRERQVQSMMDSLERSGVRVYSRQDDAQLHVSGHAGRDEQARMLELTRPRAFIPVHGSYVHLTRHVALAKKLGVADTLIVENGAIVELDEHTMQVVGGVPIGRIHLQAGEAIDGPILHERTRLSEGGVVVVTVRLDANGRLTSPVHVGTRGVVDHDTLHDLNVIRNAEAEVARELKKLNGPATRESVEQAASRAARRVFRDSLGFKPVVHAHVDMLER